MTSSIEKKSIQKNSISLADSLIQFADGMDGVFNNVIQRANLTYVVNYFDHIDGKADGHLHHSQLYYNVINARDGFKNKIIEDLNAGVITQVAAEKMISVADAPDVRSDLHGLALHDTPDEQFYTSEQFVREYAKKFGLVD